MCQALCRVLAILAHLPLTTALWPGYIIPTSPRRSGGLGGFNVPRAVNCQSWVRAPVTCVRSTQSSPVRSPGHTPAFAAGSCPASPRPPHFPIPSLTNTSPLGGSPALSSARARAVLAHAGLSRAPGAGHCVGAGSGCWAPPAGGAPDTRSGQSDRRNRQE